MKTKNNRNENIPNDPSTTPERTPNEPATNSNQPRRSHLPLRRAPRLELMSLRESRMTPNLHRNVSLHRRCQADVFSNDGDTILEKTPDKRPVSTDERREIESVPPEIRAIHRLNHPEEYGIRQVS